MKPVVAGLLGAVLFVVVLLVGGLLVAATHLPTIGNVLGLFGVVAGAFVASRLASGEQEHRVAAGAVTPVVSVAIALVMGAQRGALGPGVLPYVVVVALAAAFGIVMGLQGHGRAR